MSLSVLDIMSIIVVALRCLVVVEVLLTCKRNALSVNDRDSAEYKRHEADDDREEGGGGCGLHVPCGAPHRRGDSE